MIANTQRQQLRSAYQKLRTRITQCRCHAEKITK